MRNRLLYMVLGLVVLVSCTEEITVIPQDYSEKLVVHCSLNSDSFITVNVSKTNPISSNIGYNAVEDAIVNLYENGVLLGTLTHSVNGEYKMGYRPIRKKEYFIEVSSNGQKCTSLDLVPDSVRIVSLQLDTVPFLSGQQFLQFTLMPSNIENTKEYYEISALIRVREYKQILGIVVDSIETIRTVSLETLDPILLANPNNKNYKERFLLTDQALSSNSVIQFGTYDIKKLKNSEKALSVTIVLKSLSEDAYLYYNSVYNQIYYRSDPFSLPVKVLSNMENGYGAFVGVQETKVTKVF